MPTDTAAPLLTDRYDRALLYASAHHRRQLRKGSQVPYAGHVLSVSALVLEMGGSEDEAIAGLLHDVIEDGGGVGAEAEIRAAFGPAVAAMVRANSDADAEPKPPWTARKQAYIASLARKDAGALRVSLADKLHNARSILLDYRRYGEDLWSRFNAGDAANVRWYYRGLLAGFRAREADLGEGARPYVDELERTLDALDALTGAR